MNLPLPSPNPILNSLAQTGPGRFRPGVRLARAHLLLLALGLAASAPAAMQFEETFESTAVGGFPASMHQSNNGSSNTYEVVSSPTRAGNRAMRMKLQYVNSSSYRAEIVPSNNNASRFNDDTEYWVGFSTYLKDWAVDAGSAELVGQGHRAVPPGTMPTCGSGPNNFGIRVSGSTTECRVEENTACSPTSNAALPDTTAWNGSNVSNDWVDWVLHFKMSETANGFHEVWRNGVKVYSKSNVVNATSLYALCCDPIPAANKYYYFKIGVYKWGWQGGPSAVSSRELFVDELRIWVGAGGSYATVAPGGGVSIPDAPNGLNASLVASNRIDLTWTDNSTNETQFRIERKVGGGTYALLANAGALAGSGGTGSYSDTNLNPSTSYSYQVRAEGTDGNSSWSNEAGTNTPGSGAGPMASYPFTTLNTASNDFSGQGNTLSFVNGAAYDGAGQPGGGLLLDGVDAYAQAADSTGLNITGDQLTVAAWVRFDAVDATPEIIVSKPVSGTQHVNPYHAYSLHRLGDGTLRFYVVIGGVNKAVASPSSVVANTWYHVVGVYDGTALHLYINGAEVGTPLSVTGNLTGYATPLRLGVNGGYGEALDGRLDGVRVYNVGLTPEEVQALYNGGAPFVAPTITETEVGGNDMMIRFGTGLDGVYQVERTDTLNPATWVSVADNILGTGDPVQITDPNALIRPQTFYRVRLAAP